MAHCSLLEDSIMMEARNLRNMTMAQTPLLGEENTPLHAPSSGGTGFESATPRHNVAFTPNPLVTPLHREVNGTTSTNGMADATPLRTPLRDNLSINPEGRSSFPGDTPQEQRARLNAGKRTLKTAFENLPKPENNFELLVPDDEVEGVPVIKAELTEEDAAERDARLQRQQEEERQKVFTRRSQVVQRGLPRPPNVDVEGLLRHLTLAPSDDPESGRAESLITAELARLLYHDAVSFPIPSTLHPGGTQSSYEMPPDDYVSKAKAEVHLELAKELGFPGASADHVRNGVFAMATADWYSDELSWAHFRRGLVLDPASHQWVSSDGMSDETRTSGYASMLEDYKTAMAREATRAAKVEKKLGITLGGYVSRARDLEKRITDACDELQRAQIDLESFSRLRANESAVGPTRVSTLKEEVERLESRERVLQTEYAELESEKQETESRVVLLEERVMAEAELLNEAALAEMEQVNISTDT